MMNDTLIIEAAAKSAGLSIPLDDETTEISTSLISSFREAKTIIDGIKNGIRPSKTDWNWLDELKAEAEEYGE